MRLCCLPRLNFRLSQTCHETINKLCKDACNSAVNEQPCGGTVLRCLTDQVSSNSYA